MIKGLYTSAMGMLIQESALDTSTNNLANASTTGYKKDRVTYEEFPNVLERRMHDTKMGPGQDFYVPPKLGNLGTGVILDRVTTNHEGGALRETANPMDLALTGKAYMMVETPQGIRFTKNGRLRMSQEGFLVNQNGHKVIGYEGGLDKHTPVFTKGNKLSERFQYVELEQPSDFEVNEIGQIVGTNMRLVKAVFKDTNQIEKEGADLFRLTDGSALHDTDQIFKQGFLEGSNVNIVQEMAQMIKVSRAYEANAKILSGIDDRLGQAVREVGNLR